MIEILKEIAYTITPVLSALVGWFIGKQRAKAEVEQIRSQTDTTEIENSSRIIELYKGAVADMEDRHRLKHDELTVLYEKKISQLQEEISTFERKYKETTEIFERKIKLLEEENGFQKLKNEELKHQLKEMRIKYDHNSLT